jgi:hypothetical protein
LIFEHILSGWRRHLFWLCTTAPIFTIICKLDELSGWILLRTLACPALGGEDLFRSIRLSSHDNQCHILPYRDRPYRLLATYQPHVLSHNHRKSTISHLHKLLQFHLHPLPTTTSLRQLRTVLLRRRKCTTISNLRTGYSRFKQAVYSGRIESGAVPFTGGWSPIPFPIFNPVT